MDTAGFIKYTYDLREALGFGRLYSLSHLINDAANMRKALVACAPFAHAAIVAAPKEVLGYIGGADTTSRTPVTVTIQTTLGELREARRALFVIAMEPPLVAEQCGSEVKP